MSSYSTILKTVEVSLEAVKVAVFLPDIVSIAVKGKGRVCLACSHDWSFAVRSIYAQVGVEV